MSEQGPGDGYADDGYLADLPTDQPRPRRRGNGCGISGCLASLVALAVLVGIGYVGLTRGVSFLEDRLAGAADYPGPGQGQVMIEVKQGDSGAQIGNTLKQAGVVESVQAFTDALTANPDATKVQVGYYKLKKQMQASDAVKILVDPANLVKSLVTIPEGSRLTSITTIVAKATGFKAAAIGRLLADPSSIGLPAEAHGNAEGYLFPATYSVTPGMTAQQLLRQMVAKTASVEKSLDMASRARALGLTPHQVMTVASILEYEASRDQDYPKVAEAIYNRLKIGMPLQSDATVAYANGTSGRLATTAQERAIDSPYNTYRYPGLPVGPIGSPGEKTIQAALNPTPGPWLYWVVVNLRTGETDFATTYAEHLANVAKYRAYCQTSSAC